MRDLRISLVRIDHIPPSKLTELNEKSNCTENIEKEEDEKTQVRKRRRMKKLTQSEVGNQCRIYELRKRVNREESEKSPISMGVTTRNMSKILSTSNVKIKKKSKTVLHGQGSLAVQNLKKKRFRRRGKLPCQIQENVVNSSITNGAHKDKNSVEKPRNRVSIIENVTIIEANRTTGNSHACTKVAKYNTKKRMKNVFPDNVKKFKLNGSKRLDISNRVQEVITNSENRITLKKTISMTKKNICYLCDKSFNTQKALEEHMFFIHDVQTNNPVVCNSLNNSNEESGVSEKTVEIYEGAESNELQTKDLMEQQSRPNIVPYDHTAEPQSKVTMKNSKWKCAACKKSFGLISNYLRHKFYMHNDETVVHICDNCSKVLTSVGMVNLHICRNVTSWFCRRCNIQFPNGVSLRQHNINRHVEVFGPHTCTICNLNFLTNYMLEKHTSVHHTCSNDTKKWNSAVSHNTDNTVSIYREFQLQKMKEFNLRRLPWLPKKNGTQNYTLNSANRSFKNNQCTCIVCNLTYPNKLLMKLHLEKIHNVMSDICQLCNDLFIAGRITWHLIDRHIISDNVYLIENGNTNKIKLETMENCQYDLTKILGMKRLLSIYSYQRVAQTKQSKQFNCHACSRKFMSDKNYKRHYLKQHDTSCILCNVEFEDNVKAMDHKLKTHTSLDAYLWAIESIVTALSKLKQYISAIDDVADKLRELTIQSDEYDSAVSEKNRYKNHLTPIYRTEILELASEDGNITLSTRVGYEVDSNIIVPNLYATANKRRTSNNCRFLDNSRNITIDGTSFDVYPLKNKCGVLNRNTVSVILVPEEDLWTYRDNIGKLASKLCSSCTMYSEEYITLLLTEYMRNIKQNVDK